MHEMQLLRTKKSDNVISLDTVEIITYSSATFATDKRAREDDYSATKQKIELHFKFVDPYVCLSVYLSIYLSTYLFV